MLYVIICTYELCMIRCIFDATYFAQEFPHFWTFRSGKTKNLQQLLQTWTTGPSLCFLVFFMFFSFYFSLSEPPSWKLNRENYPPINKKTPITTPLSFCRFLDPLNTPHCSPSTCRDTRAQKEWKVHANTSPARSPTKSWARCFLTQAERLGLTKKQRCYSNKFWITLPIVTSG